MRRNVWPVGLLVLSMTSIAGQSQTPDIATGDNVRISAKTLGTVARVGILTKVESDKLLLLDPAPSSAAWEIPLDRVTKLEVRRPNAGNHKHRGALIGMITGFVVIGGIGYAATHCGECEYDGAGAILAGPAGGIGALAGFFIGRAQKTEGWQPVPLPLTVNLTPTRDGQIQFQTLVRF